MIRSMLFVPGNSPSMLQNADIHGADALILDLEDAVALDQKDAARLLVSRAMPMLRGKRAQIIIRINPLSSPYFLDDIKKSVPLMPDMLMPTKVGSKADIDEISENLSKVEKELGLSAGTTKLMPLIEGALGIENAFNIASASKRVLGIFLGAEDLSSDLHAKRTKTNEEILYARGRIVMAARAANIDAYDTPFTDVNDDEGLIADAALARQIGFSGKAAISPRHIKGINKEFTPAQKEIDYAKAVINAIEEGIKQGKGAVSLYGKMIDRPIEIRARQLLDVAKALGLED